MGDPVADWASVAAQFTPDGSLRDIYVLDTTEEDCQAALNAIRATGLPERFFVDGELDQMPEKAVEVFAVRQRATPSLHVGAAGLSINCHFFAEDEIEFDIDPREVSGPERFDAVVCFMKVLAGAVHKDVVLTHENTPSAVILKCLGR